ncbi:hypothetical protein NMG60_11021228 [Bertholletia excelsa]
MSSASELFYNRRSRFGRSGDDLGLDSSLDRNFHHHAQRNGRHHNRHYLSDGSEDSNPRRDRWDHDDCDRFRRPPLTRHQSRRTFNSEHGAVRPEGTTTTSGNPINLDDFSGIRNRPRFRMNERLPGSVILARQRLLERLRGVSQSGNRGSNRASSGINQNDLTMRDCFSLVDAAYWESENSRERVAIELVPPTDHQLLMPQENRKKPLGLTQEAINCLQLEVFDKDNCKEGDIGNASQECSICLQSFLGGDQLICLPCAHRFHTSCLVPWVRTCGDCPYCRRGVFCDNI